MDTKARDKVRVTSLRINGVEFGPLDLKLTEFGENHIDGVLGTAEIQRYRLNLDEDRCSAVFDLGPETRRADSSPLEVFRGRPTLLVDYAGETLRFVLDTGSSGNWLFSHAHRRLTGVDARDISEQAKAVFATFPVRKAVDLRNVTIGGQTHHIVSFFLAPQDTFGGEDTPEDGIIGLGTLMHGGAAIIDFPGGNFRLKPERGSRTNG